VQEFAKNQSGTFVSEEVIGYRIKGEWNTRKIKIVKKGVKEMQYLKEFLRNKRGVSPVIATILMVAITVVMGAVIAGFVYGYLGNTHKAPTVALTVIDNPTGSSSLIIKDTGGEEIAAGDWKCSVTEGKESPADFSTQSETGANSISTGKNLVVVNTTVPTPVAIAPGPSPTPGPWYHIVAVHVPSDSIMLDTNVQVR
jgi:flagellin-like protein